MNGKNRRWCLFSRHRFAYNLSSFLTKGNNNVQLATIDEAIKQRKEEIARLEAEKQQAVKRQQALDNLRTQVTEYAVENDLTLQDVFAALEKDIEKWVKSLRNESEGIHQHLKSYYARVLSEDGPGTVKKQPPEPKLAAGLYTNPYNGEQILKKTRAPKELREWVLIYGLGTVETWRK